MKSNTQNTQSFNKNQKFHSSKILPKKELKGLNLIIPNLQYPPFLTEFYTYLTVF